MKKYIVISILLLFAAFAITQDHGVDFIVESLTVEGVLVLQHGFMAFGDSTQTIALTEDVYAKITQESDSLYSTYVIDTATFLFQGDSIKILTAGHIDLSWTLSYSTGGGSEVVHGAIFINNIIQANRGRWTRTTSTNDIGNVCGAFAYTASANDWISFRVMNETNNNDIVAKAGNVVIHR